MFRALVYPAYDISMRFLSVDSHLAHLISFICTRAGRLSLISTLPISMSAPFQLSPPFVILDFGTLCLPLYPCWPYRFYNLL